MSAFSSVPNSRCLEAASLTASCIPRKGNNQISNHLCFHSEEQKQKGCAKEGGKPWSSQREPVWAKLSPKDSSCILVVAAATLDYTMSGLLQLGPCASSAPPSRISPEAPSLIYSYSCLCLSWRTRWDVYPGDCSGNGGDFLAWGWSAADWTGLFIVTLYEGGSLK